MRSIVLLLIALLISLSTMAQSPKLMTPENMHEYIRLHLYYPYDAWKVFLTGTVKVKFSIDERGKLQDSIFVYEKVHPSIDSEAVRVIREMPDWKPEHYEGKPTAFTRLVAIEFGRWQMYRHRKKNDKTTPVTFYYTDDRYLPEPTVNLANFFYDRVTWQTGLEGTVRARFTVKEDSTVDDVRIVPSGNRNFDEAVMAALKEMPKWIPARKNGKLISSEYRYSAHLGLGSLYGQKEVKVLITHRLWFPGKDSAHNAPTPGTDLKTYFAGATHYPEDAQQKGAYGTVRIEFDISESGYAGNFRVIDPLFPSLDAEALRLLKNLPRWQPAMANGDPVTCKARISIRFEVFNNPVKFVLPQRKPIEGAVLSYADKMPEPGYDIQRYVVENMQYPDDAIDAEAKGKVTLRFIVDKEGNIDSIRVLKPLFPSLDSISVALMERMPPWTPGTDKGQPVNVWYTQPIHFAYRIVIDSSDKNATPDFNLEQYLISNMQINMIPGGVDVTGNVIVQFTVNPDGSTSDPIIEKSLHPDVDKEALRLVTNMPRWIPAQEKGVLIASRMALPIYFDTKKIRKGK